MEDSPRRFEAVVSGIGSQGTTLKPQGTRMKNYGHVLVGRRCSGSEGRGDPEFLREFLEPGVARQLLRTFGQEELRPIRLLVVVAKACQEATRLRAGQGGVARDPVDQVPSFALQEISAELLVPDFQVPAPRSAPEAPPFRANKGPKGAFSGWHRPFLPAIGRTSRNQSPAEILVRFARFRKVPKAAAASRRTKMS